MVGGMRKAMIYLGLADGEEQYEAQQRTAVEPVREQQHERPSREETQPTDPAAVRSAARDAAWEEDAVPPRPSRPIELVDDEYRAPVTPIKRASQGREESTAVHQLTTIHPRSYNDAKLIGESFRGGIPVIMNVTDLSESDAKRLVDFSAGLVFGLHGSIERVTNKVFLLTPSDVEVLTEGSVDTDTETSFFDQK